MKALILLAICGLSVPALADRLPLPSDAPASYQAECGSCHLAYPPALLNARDWRFTMTGLKSHFGSDAAVDGRAGREIAAFLERNAGSSSRLEGAGNPPRISRTGWFTRKHRKVPDRFWTDKRVGSAANCESCHGGAARGHYGEHDIAIPELRR